jgi:hypothetical protein
MMTSTKLLAEQAWSLRENLVHRLETERYKHVASFRLCRLKSIEKHAYSRYMRRLHKLWA